MKEYDPITDDVPGAPVYTDPAPVDEEILHTILLSRIYDVLIGILNETNPTAAQAVMDKHNQGKLLQPEIWVSPNQ